MRILRSHSKTSFKSCREFFNLVVLISCTSIFDFNDISLERVFYVSWNLIAELTELFLDLESEALSFIFSFDIFFEDFVGSFVILGFAFPDSMIADSQACALLFS